MSSSSLAFAHKSPSHRMCEGKWSFQQIHLALFFRLILPWLEIKSLSFGRYTEQTGFSISKYWGMAEWCSVINSFVYLMCIINLDSVDRRLGYNRGQNRSSPCCLGQCGIHYELREMGNRSISSCIINGGVLTRLIKVTESHRCLCLCVLC